MIRSSPATPTTKAPIQLKLPDTGIAGVTGVGDATARVQVQFVVSEQDGFRHSPPTQVNPDAQLLLALQELLHDAGGIGVFVGVLAGVFVGVLVGLQTQSVSPVHSGFRHMFPEQIRSLEQFAFVLHD